MTDEGADPMGRRPLGLLGRGAAELLVIVAGVLIALWIEGWREARAAAVAEEGYLERLEEDLVADSARIADRIESEIRLERRARTADRFAEEGWAATRDTVGVLTAYHLAGFINFVRLQRTTWDDLVSTGNVGLITDDAARRGLGAYYRSVRLDFLVEMDDNRKEQIWYRYRPALERHFPMGFLNTLPAGEPKRPLPEIDFEELRDDPEVRTGLRAAAGMAQVYLGQLGELAEDNAETLALVRAAQRGGDP